VVLGNAVSAQDAERKTHGTNLLKLSTEGHGMAAKIRKAQPSSAG